MPLIDVANFQSGDAVHPTVAWSGVMADTIAAVVAAL